MDDQDRVSQASSVATISYIPVLRESDGKVQTFGKRCQAAKRDPNCPVVIRGWLNKKDSTGLKLWKRRWFVLSNYCLYYYKDSREESVLGSIPLPSYKILFCTPRECKNRKFTFKVVHQGMRSYFFSADTQEDMLGWVRALSQSAMMEQDSSLNRTPSPPDFSRRRVCGPNQEEDSLPGQNTPPMQTENMGTGSLPSRGQLGSRPHTPVGRVDIRPHDDPTMVPQTLYYAPASPKLEFKSTPTTPVTERWQSLSKPTATYGSVHHIPSGRRPLGKSYSTGAHADLLPPLPPSSRATHAPHPPHHHHHHHHHHRSHLSVCVLPPAMSQKPDPRETPAIRPLESDADAVLTRLCGCDKLLQSLSLELAQLQMDKDSVHCALEVSRLQLEEWKSQGPRAQEEALTQKALLQEELVTIRARMCDVSLEMERVWSQYERMESELSVIRSHLQHICNFGMPQDQSQAQRELWMMEDILAGLKVNRDHFRFLLGLERHHTFQPPAPHPGSPGSPTERLQSGLPMDVEQEPPVRPPLPQELQENHQNRDHCHGWAESPYEGIYSHTVQRRGNSQSDLLNVKTQKDAFDSQSGSKWIPPDTMNQSTKKMKMSEEEQIERMKRNQERLSNKKKNPIPGPSAQTQSQCSETKDEAPFPLRVTRVVTAVLPTSLVARRVSVEDPPPELDNPLPEQIPLEMQERLAEQNKKMLNKPPRRLLLDSPDQNRSSAEMHQDQPVKKTSRQQHLGALRSSKREPWSEASRAESTETSRNQVRDHAGLGNGNTRLDVRAEEGPSALLTPDIDPDPCLTPEQREAKLRRVERIRERVIRSHFFKLFSDHKSHISSGSCGDDMMSPAELQLSSGTSQEEKEGDGHVKISESQVKFGNKTRPKDHSSRTGVAKTKIKRPASPYHISSMTVYQKDGGKGFTSHKEGEEQKLEKSAADDYESDFSSSDLRAKWFLSTSQWQGCIPLQIPGIDSLCGEGISDIENQPACTDDVADSNEMSSAVSKSLEKMKENHSLFYKIACDISISDTDITKNDANSSAQTPCRPEEEEEELPITECAPDEATHNVERSSNQESEDSRIHLSSDLNENSSSLDNKLQDSTLETQDITALNTSASPEKEPCVYEEIPQSECEATSRQESQLKVGETSHGANPDQAVDEHAKMREGHGGAKESEDRKVNQDRADGPRKCRSLSEENKEAVQERGNNHSITPPSSVYEGGRVTRSASFGKARVTVLRTSF
ncbi:hypothetical protein L3Q82_010747 [Scortum barcoo]|uniref:Uncharacterized protein n=1 Tax=Scortum barcoo TaxID=214431 RepID=A0ACB8WCC3_9TELE|nr:hypothetical protein L3Q82_010747 [Scortum barcoo]